MRGHDIAAAKFGRLTAVRQDPYTWRRWLFLCECGTEKSILKVSVTSGKVRSCGCLHRERARSGLNQTRHGQARKGQVTRLHSIWRGIIKRVDCTSGSNFAKYAGRGIKMCPEWRTFETFRDWAETAEYREDLWIERNDNDGDYEPGNCRWATQKEQARNRRTTRWITISGKTKSLAEWCEHQDLPYPRVKARLDLLGWTPERALEVG